MEPIQHRNRLKIKENRKGGRVVRVALFGVLLGGGCAGTSSQVAVQPTAAPEAAPTPATQQSEAAAQQSEPAAQPDPGGVGVERVKVSALMPNEARTVRVEVTVVEHGQLRMVPPRAVFTVRDGSGSMRVLLEERKLIDIGTRLELIGRYAPVPAPGYTGPGEAPEELIFVIERYFELPPGA